MNEAGYDMLAEELWNRLPEVIDEPDEVIVKKFAEVLKERLELPVTECIMVGV